MKNTIVDTPARKSGRKRNGVPDNPKREIAAVSTARPRTRKAIQKLMRDVLVELMQRCDQGSLQLGAVKELRELLGLKDGPGPKTPAPARKSEEERRNDDEEHAACLADARALLAEFAEAKSGRVAEPREVDQGGEAAAADAGG